MMDKRAWTEEELAAYRSDQARKARGEKGPRHGVHKETYKSATKFDRAFFVAWDGEGETREDGTHAYVYLAAGWYDAQGRWQERAIEAKAGERLTTRACVDLFFRVQRETPRQAVHVGFSLTYDWTHILYDLSRAAAWDALVNNERHYGWSGKYGFKVRPRHMLQVIGPRQANGKRETFRMYDVFGFFQSSFVKAIENWLGAEYEDLDLIRVGKAQRTTRIEHMREYNRAELRALIALMQALHAALKDADLKIRRWDGAGAAASAAYGKYMTKDWFERARAAFAEDNGSSLNEAVAGAYFGGRIELLKYGTWRGDLYHADINSAYPAAMVTIPDLAAGRWEFVEDPDLDALPAFSIVYVRWSFGERLSVHKQITPFPLRTHDGRILYPPAGEGWHWLSEVLAARDGMRRGARAEAFDWSRDCQLEIDAAWCFYPDDPDARPFAWVGELYEMRKVMKADGRAGAEKAIKLAINSLYGKLAQQAGYYARVTEIANPYSGVMRVIDNGHIHVPPFHNLAIAGYITAYTRAQLLRAALVNPSSVIALATDGIYSTKPVAAAEEGKRLGGWSTKVYKNAVAVFVQPGVYFIRENGKWYEYCRGFPYSSGVTEGERQAAINERVEGIWSMWAQRDEDGFRVPAQRLITLRAAAAGAWDKRGQFAAVYDVDAQGALREGRRMKVFDAAGARVSVKDHFWRDPRAALPTDRLIATRPRASAVSVSFPYRSIPLAESKVEAEEELLDAINAALEHA